MRRGYTLVELMAASVALMVILAGLFQVIISTMSSYRYTTGSSSSIVDAGELVNQVAAEIRRAAICDARKGCSSNSGSAVAQAASGSLALFTTASGQKLTVANSNGDVLLTKDSGSDVMAEDAQMKFRYFLAPEYNARELIKTQPSALQYKEIIAIEVTATVERDGVTDAYTATVRLRNGPNKTVSL